jgi:16S rRNA (cytosine1402-N4)-methyltransferase
MNNETFNTHTTVLLKQAVDALLHNNYHTNGIYIDGTFGRGGHSREILNAINNYDDTLNFSGKLIAIDKDVEALNAAQQNQTFQQALQKNVFGIEHNSFANIPDILHKQGFKANAAQGILLDLGISSPQIDVAERGFSFMRNGPLDMRMNQTQGISVAQALQQLSIAELSDILWQYGEEKQSYRIAQAIHAYQQQNTCIEDTLTLANIVAKVIKQTSAQHPATRTFQALRIYINHELDDLKKLLADLPHILAPQGIIVIISFHSLEDRMVKQQFSAWANPQLSADIPKHLRVLHQEIMPTFKLIGKYKPSQDEIAANPRARSAIMRVAQKF